MLLIYYLTVLVSWVPFVWSRLIMLSSCQLHDILLLNKFFSNTVHFSLYYKQCWFIKFDWKQHITKWMSNGFYFLFQYVLFKRTFMNKKYFISRKVYLLRFIESFIKLVKSSHTFEQTLTFSSRLTLCDLCFTAYFSFPPLSWHPHVLPDLFPTPSLTYCTTSVSYRTCGAVRGTTPVWEPILTLFGRLWLLIGSGDEVGQWSVGVVVMTPLRA